MKHTPLFLAELAAASLFCVAQSKTGNQTIHGTWKVGEWSACISGAQHRTVQCIGPMHEPVQASYCPSPAPVSEMKCTNPKSPHPGKGAGPTK